MKKTIAVGSASVLGLLGATVGVAGSAQAIGAPTGPACLTDAEHVPALGAQSNWYMACVPQYSLADVTFSITSATPFPAGFAKLDDPSVAVASNANPAGNVYMGVSPVSPGLAEVAFSSETPDRQNYEATVINAISGVSEINLTDLPAACTGTYDAAYRIDYLPTSVTFTQVVAGEVWEYQVVANAGPTFLGLTFSDPLTLDVNRALCAVSSAATSAGANDQDIEWLDVEAVATTRSEQTLSPYFGLGKNLPDIARSPFTPAVPAPPAPPQLAATGVDVGPGLGLAATFLALGVAAGWLDRRRARAEKA